MGPLDLSRSAHAVLRPLPARIDDGLWAERRCFNREVLLPAAKRQLEAAGAFGNLRGEPHRGPVYLDSDLYKWLEALGWAGCADDETIALIATAQDADGYVNTFPRAREDRYADLAWAHELYCAGHLIQAAIAHTRARGDRALLAVARRLADHLVERFAAAPGLPGHPEVEMALVELHRLTREPAYLALAATFVDRRGHCSLQPARLGSAYFQDDVPVRGAREVTGHAVRALYLACGVTDLYLETGEARLLQAMRAQWEDMAYRKAYVTGGVGARWDGEAFGAPFELPPDGAYAETCAAVASVMWSWRMMLATGEARFADLAERTLLNGVLAGVALREPLFAYVNPLETATGANRRPWFECACCPPNLMRTLASLQHLLATHDDDGVQLHQYAGGAVAGLDVRTDYPWDGRVEIDVREAPGVLSLRVPAWCAGARLDGRPVAPGYARATPRAGERVVLELPMPARRTPPDPRVEAVRGRVAIERGPLVYCAEGDDLDALRLGDEAPLRVTDEHVIEAGALRAVPYFAWGNGALRAMRVWLPAQRQPA